MATDLEQLQDDPAIAPFAGLLSDFVELEKKRRDLEAELDDCKKQIAKLQEPLTEHFAASNMQNCKAGGLTVFLKTTKYVNKRSDVETAEICAVLESLGLGYMVSEGYSASSLKSRVNEYLENDEPVPDPLASLLKIGEVTKLATRRAS